MGSIINKLFINTQGSRRHKHKDSHIVLCHRGSVVNGKSMIDFSSITPHLCLPLAAWLGTSAEVWIEMQAARDLWEAEQKTQPKITPIRLAV